MKVVWILGAGFSRPLGGPLLFDLFSEPKKKAVFSSTALANTAKKLRGEDVNHIDAIYGLNLRPSERRVPWQRGHPWSNAEEFVEYVELASLGGTGRGSTASAYLARMFRRVAGRNYDYDSSSFSAKVRQYLALQCEVFLDQAQDAARLERWDPYRRWAGHVSSSDTIITFNYDRVVEVAFEAKIIADPSLTEPALEVVIPNPQNHCPTAGSGPPVYLYKLHGSVDWAEGPDDTVLPSYGTSVRNFLVETAPVIAVPGPQKKTRARKTFATLWQPALRAIREADAVVCVGYRFPETDSFALNAVLGALRNNQSRSGRLVVRFVLGDDTRAAERILGLFRWNWHTDDSHTERKPGHLYIRTKEHERVVVIEPLFAQDFLALFDRKGLINAPLPAT